MAETIFFEEGCTGIVNFLKYHVIGVPSDEQTFANRIFCISKRNDEFYFDCCKRCEAFVSSIHELDTSKIVSSISGLQLVASKLDISL